MNRLNPLPRMLHPTLFWSSGRHRVRVSLMPSMVSATPAETKGMDKALLDKYQMDEPESAMVSRLAAPS